MTYLHNNQFNREAVIINPGEQYVGDDYIIQTVLGSCIAVALYSEEKHCGGMNHFLLPGTKEGVDILHSEAGRYGQTSMDLLINGLMKNGINKKQLKAKVFGGGAIHIHKKDKDSTLTVGMRNINFIMEYLEKERIPIVSQDVGGMGGRKILFFPDTGKVLLSRLNRTQIENTVKQEYEYLQNLKKKQSKIIFFQDDN